jgi:hypothetical protein
MINNMIKTFDFDVYKYNYDDIQKLFYNNRKKAFSHWALIGIKEGRTCKLIIKPEHQEEYEFFDWIKYLENNLDLKQVFSTRAQSWIHWIKNGKKEGRKYYSINKYHNEIYLSKIDEFMNLYKNTKNEILSNPKIEYRYFCYRYLNYIRKIELPEIVKNKNLEAVLIEYREFPHLEFIIRNAINKLGNDWSFTVVCGNLNYQFMIELCNNISPNIKIIKSNYDNLNQTTYSIYLASLEFWNLLVGEKILIYQEDSCIFRSNINDAI